jgi:hypothetical protein
MKAGEIEEGHSDMSSYRRRNDSRRRPVSHRAVPYVPMGKQ